MRPRRPQPLLFLAFVVIMGALMYAKDVPVPNSNVGLKTAAGRLKVYYQETPPPKDWAVAAIASRDGEVWVDLTVPDAMAADFLHVPRRKMLDSLRGQCPPKTDKAWTVLLKTQDIEVRGLSPEGKALAAVSCRAAQP